MEYLYHFTSILHLDEILKDGFLKLTPSNLIKPTDLKKEKVLDADGQVFYNIVSEKSDPIKPVVWLTDKSSVDIAKKMGLHDAKTEVRLKLPMKDDYQWWVTWADQNKMNKSWRKTFTTGCDYGSWYVCEHEIKLTDVKTIENIITGEIYWQS